MRLQYLAKEERDVVGHEHSELVAIKNELAKLTELTHASHTTASSSKRSLPYGQTHAGLPQSQLEISRLTRERQSLLNAKLYTPDDPVIRQLDARIAQLMAQSGHVGPG
jgi:hypothetical protein